MIAGNPLKLAKKTPVTREQWLARAILYEQCSQRGQLQSTLARKVIALWIKKKINEMKKWLA